MEAFNNMSSIKLSKKERAELFLRNAVLGLFENIENYKNELSTLLVDNFQIIGN